MTLARQAAANEVAVRCGAEYETWITGDRADDRTAAGWENSGYHDLLHSCWSGICMVDNWMIR